MPNNIDITVQSQLDQQIFTSHGNENAKQLIQESNNPFTGNLDTQKLSTSLAAIAEQDWSLAEPLIQAVQQELESTNSFDAAHFAKDMQKQLSWLGEQYIGVSKGAADMLLDTAKGLGTLAVGAVKHYADTSPAGLVFDGLKRTGVIPDSLPLPSYKASQETSGEIIDVSKAIANNPGLILEAITEPIVKRWTEERYGEAIGYAGMEIASLVFTPAKLSKLGKLSNLTKLTTVDELADALSLAKELNKQVPGDLVSHFDELVSAKRASGELDLVVEAARKSDTLPELMKSGKLTQAELDELVIKPEEFLNSANGSKTYMKSEVIGAQATSIANGGINKVHRGGGDINFDFIDNLPSSKMYNQTKPFNCAPGCGRQFLLDEGIDIPESILEDLLKTSNNSPIDALNGTNIDNFVDGLNKALINIDSTYTVKGGSLAGEFFEPLMNLGKPWIAGLRKGNTEHFVIVDGYENGIVKVRDPWGLGGPNNGIGGSKATLSVDNFKQYWRDMSYEGVLWEKVGKLP